MTGVQLESSVTPSPHLGLQREIMISIEWCPQHSVPYTPMHGTQTHYRVSSEADQLRTAAVQSIGGRCGVLENDITPPLRCLSVSNF
jgi:hypothetical protein